jgi:hypothetical protein
MRSRWLVIAACCAALVACSEATLYTPLPADKLPYAGDWKGGGISLQIDPGGRVIYERKNGSASTSVDAPLKEFKGDNFIVGVAFMKTEFAVSAPPHEDGGVWKMTVDGVELTRSVSESL